MQGRIGTGALRVFSDKLTGYNFITGLYGLSGKGNLLYLTIDSDVCAAAYRALDGRKGAVGIYNYITGDIVCLVSTPGFDPEDPPEITEENEDQYDGIYLNRFLLSAYTPGSIFKIVTSAAAIDCIGDIEDRVFSCTGSMIIDGVEITCPHAHGDVDFQEALTVSCNCAFAQIADELGSTNLFAYAESAGLLNPLDVSGIKTQTGSIDLNNISDGELAWAGIGQHKDLVNPCAFMYYMGSIA